MHLCFYYCNTINSRNKQQIHYLIKIIDFCLGLLYNHREYKVLLTFYGNGDYMIWHSATADEVIKELNTDREKGLSNDKASERLKECGRNLSVNKDEISRRSAVIKQLQKPAVIILLALLVIYILRELVTGRNDFLLPAVTFLAVCAKEALCVWFEYRSRNMLSSLQNRRHVSAKVIRGGKKLSIEGDRVVPGDIMLLCAGDYIPADARLIEAYGLRCDESVLFGEKDTVVVPKDSTAVLDDITPIAERTNMVYCGCHCMTGTAVAVVVGTGDNAEIRRSVIKDKVFFHKGVQDKINDRYSDFSKIFRAAALFAGALIVVTGTFATGGIIGWGKFLEALIAAVAFYIAVVPGSFPTRIACLMALGIKRLEKDKASIFNPQTVEKLAGVTVICSDKTGTLTQNRMVLQKVYDGENIVDLGTGAISRQCEIAMRFGSLSCDFTEGTEPDHTEAAIMSAAARYLNIVKQDFDTEFPRVTSIALTPERKIKTTVNMIEGRIFDIVRGAPDIILDRCASADREKVKKAYEQMCSEGLRVLAISYKILDALPSDPRPESLEYDLQFLGLFGIADRERRGIVSDIALCRHAGISTVMFTGDHINTAETQAKKMGILSDGDVAVTGEQLDNLNDDELAAAAPKIKVCARISSDQRIRMVEALHKNGETVLLTADSAANYAAMSYADVGCAMGKTGTDVAKGNADLIVYDDSYSSIVKTIRNARGIFGNFCKYTNYYLTLCVSVFLTMICGTIIFGNLYMPTPLIIIGAIFALVFPIASIGYETADRSIMDAAPRTVGEKMFDRRSIIMSALSGIAVAAVPVIVSLLTKSDPGSGAVTFISLVLSLIFYMFATRSPEPFFKRIVHNRFMLTISGLCVIISVVIAATPAGQLFGLHTAEFSSWIPALLVPFAIPFVFEILKLFGITVNK